MCSVRSECYVAVAARKLRVNYHSPQYKQLQLQHKLLKLHIITSKIKINISEKNCQKTPK
jgi:hypothetical protein